MHQDQDALSCRFLLPSCPELCQLGPGTERRHFGGKGNMNAAEAEGKTGSLGFRGTTYLAEEPQNLVAPVVDLEVRGAREAVEAVPEGIEHVEEYLRHGCGRN